MLICEFVAKKHGMKSLNKFLFGTLKWIHSHFELLFWIGALIGLYFLTENKTAVSLCPFSLLGLGHCPGCGIGHAIHYALYLQLSVSFHHHPLGIFAVMIIFIRIKQLTYTQKPVYETQSH